VQSLRNSTVNADVSVAHYSLISGLFLSVIISSWMERNICAWPATLRERTPPQSRDTSPWDVWMYVGS